MELVTTFEPNAGCQSVCVVDILHTFDVVTVEEDPPAVPVKEDPPVAPAAPSASAVPAALAGQEQDQPAEPAAPSASAAPAALPGQEQAQPSLPPVPTALAAAAVEPSADDDQTVSVAVPKTRRVNEHFRCIAPKSAPEDEVKEPVSKGDALNNRCVTDVQSGALVQCKVIGSNCYLYQPKGRDLEVPLCVPCCVNVRIGVCCVYALYVCVCVCVCVCVFGNKCVCVH
jgi:hypothetical protein